MVRLRSCAIVARAGFKPEHVGTLPDDPSVRVSVHGDAASIARYADCQFGRCLENFVEATLARRQSLSFELLLGASARSVEVPRCRIWTGVKTNGAILRVASLGPNGQIVWPARTPTCGWFGSESGA